MTNSEIFKTAHRKAKRNEFNVWGTYSERFSRALKSIYFNIRMNKKRAADKIVREEKAAKKQAILVAKRKLTRKPQNPVSCYISVHHWEYNLQAK